MDGSTVAVILNPVAGGGKTIGLLPKVVEALRAQGRQHHIHVTTGPDEAPEVAKRFSLDGAGVIVAVGGDGTINEVANGILESGRTVPMGIVSSGHGSDFVRTTKSPKAVDQAIVRICAGQTTPVDVGLVTSADGTSRAFVNVAGLGFDAVVAERTLRTKLPGATLPYLWGLAGGLVSYKNIHVTVDADGTTISGIARSVIVANATYFAGGMKIAPTAVIDDGLLDLVIIGDFPRFELVRNVHRVYRGTHLTHPKVNHLQAQSVRVESLEPARVQLDGELGGWAPATFTVRPGALLLAG